MKTLYRHMEALGLRAAAASWLRRRRLPIIMTLAILSWALVVVFGMIIYRSAG